MYDNNKREEKKRNNLVNVSFLLCLTMLYTTSLFCSSEKQLQKAKNFLTTTNTTIDNSIQQLLDLGIDPSTLSLETYSRTAYDHPLIEKLKEQVQKKEKIEHLLGNHKAKIEFSSLRQILRNRINQYYVDQVLRPLVHEHATIQQTLDALPSQEWTLKNKGVPSSVSKHNKGIQNPILNKTILRKIQAEEEALETRKYDICKLLAINGIDPEHAHEKYQDLLNNKSIPLDNCSFSVPASFIERSYHQNSEIRSLKEEIDRKIVAFTNDTHVITLTRMLKPLQLQIDLMNQLLNLLSERHILQSNIDKLSAKMEKSSLQ